MNVTEANKIIAICNHVAELVTSLGVAVEQAAWEGFEDHAGMSGARPIAAVQLAQSAMETTYRDHLVQQAAPVVAQVSLEQVCEALAGLSKAGMTAKVRELIEQAGAAKLSEVDPSKYGWLLGQAQAVADGSQ